MALVSLRGLVLQSFAYGETSKILRLLTPETGVVSVIAKGARRPKSRFGGLLEPFAEGQADFFRREGRDLHTLGGWDLRRARHGLGRDLVAFGGASLLAELVLRFGTDEPSPVLFARLSSALDAMCSPGAGSEGITIAAAWELVAILGFAPQTEQCVRCGRSLEPDEPARFDAAGGGSACSGCRPGGRVLEPAVRAALERMVAGAGAGDGPPAVGAVHRRLLRTFLHGHLSEDRPLRSLDLFIEQAAELGSERAV